MNEQNKTKIEQAYKEWTNVRDTLTEVYHLAYETINDVKSIAELNKWYDKIKDIVDRHYTLEMIRSYEGE